MTRIYIIFGALLVAVGFGFAAAIQPLLLIVGVAMALAIYCAIAKPHWLLPLALGVLVLGQVGRIPPLSGQILLLDLVVGTAFLVWALLEVAGRRKLRFEAVHFLWLGFIAMAALALILTPLVLSRSDLATNGIYLVRLVAYTSLFWGMQRWSPEAYQAKHVLNMVLWTGYALIVLGFLQLIFVPDIGFLSGYGWDPHVGRLVSTFLDPNYFGGFLAIILAVLLARTLGEGHRFPWFWGAVLMIATVLTYSRSGYLAVGIVIFGFGLRYSWRILLLAVVCVVPLALAIPRVQERVLGGFSVDATAQDRVISWQGALTIIDRFPFLGVGYNNYKPASEVVGVFQGSETSQSAAGSDSSLLNVQATTGFLGFGLFMATVFAILIRAWKRSARKDNSPYRSAAFALLFIAPAIFVHSFFVNSLFYPFIFLPLALLVGVLLSETPAS